MPSPMPQERASSVEEISVVAHSPAQNGAAALQTAQSAPAPELLPSLAHPGSHQGSTSAAVLDDRLSAPRVSPPRLSLPQQRTSSDGAALAFGEERVSGRGLEERRVRIISNPLAQRESRDGSIAGLGTIPEASLTEQQWRQQQQQQQQHLGEGATGPFASVRKGLARLSSRLRVSMDGRGGSDLSRACSSSLGPGTKVERLEKLAQRRGGVAAQFAHRIRAMDRDGNGYVDADDLVDCMVDLAQEQQQRRLWFAFAMVSMLTTLFTIVVIVGLSVLVTEMFKDTKMQGDVMVGKSSGAPIQVSTLEFTLARNSLVVRGQGPDDAGGGSLVDVGSRLTTMLACPLDLSVDTLRHVDVLQFTLDAARNLTAFLRPTGFVLGPDALTFYTDLGNITFAEGCRAVTGSVIDTFINSGFIQGSELQGGRRLLQMANLYVSTRSGTSTSGTGYFG